MIWKAQDRVDLGKLGQGVVIGFGFLSYSWPVMPLTLEIVLSVLKLLPIISILLHFPDLVK